MPKHFLSLLLLCAALLGPASLCQAAVAGHFQFVSGNVQVIDGQGKARLARKGDEIHEGETLVSAAGASAQLLMIDKGLIALRPDTRLTIETFRFNGSEDGSEQSKLDLVRGTFRAITGLIGRTNKNNYSVKTPNATIGIRGTDHETGYVPPPPPGTESRLPPGTYNRVNVGSTFIQTEHGRLNLGANQIGFAQLNNAPVRLERTPAIFQPPGANTPQKSGNRTGNNPASDSNTGATSESSDSTTSTTAGGTTDSTSGATTGNTSDSTSTGNSSSEQSTTSSSNNTAPSNSSTTPASTSTTTTTSVTPLTSTGGTCLTCSTTTQGTQAPANTGGVGAIRSATAAGVVDLDSGATDNVRGDILRDANKLPTRLTDNSANNQFVYERNGAADVPSSGGATTVGTGSNSTWVNWGIYTGGQRANNNSGGVLEPVTHFAWMIAEGGMTPNSWLQNSLSTFSTGMTFNIVGGYTKPIDEAGGIGGQVSSLTATIAINGGVPSLTQYDLNVNDAQNRYWKAQLTAPIALTAFVDNPSGSGTSTSNNLTVSRYVSSVATVPIANGVGQANGYVIGPQSPVGIISSYSLKDSTGTAAVTGTVLVK